jgi:SAM-dependent methyltransferase
MILGGRLAEKILTRYEWRDVEAPRQYEGATKLETLFGASIWSKIKGKTVLDFGCGDGSETLAIARHGAKHVFGLDIIEQRLQSARARQAAFGIENCSFVSSFAGKADVIMSIDSFEHFSRPDSVLREMADLLRPGGKVIVSFGPPWFHPKGHHFPLFPWAHVVLTEQSMMKWRARWKSDGAARFGEVEGGLNQMSIRKFERLVRHSPLKFTAFEAVPIRVARWLHCGITREFLTSTVRCTMEAREQS